MNKVTVTKAQMETIRQCKRFAGTYNLAFITNKDNDFLCWAKPLNKMTIEQIVLAWHGYAEVEPDYVCFDEAVKAGKEGKDITFHWEKSKYKITSQNLIEWGLRNLSVSDHGLLNLVDGKWTIEGDNR